MEQPQFETIKFNTIEEIERSSGDYICISYVWTQNKKIINVVNHIVNLYEQFDRLYGYDLRDYKIWLDCVSIDENNVSHKQWSIENMGKIYKESEIVIAIVPELDEKCTTYDILDYLRDEEYNYTIVEKTIHESKWMKRAWTLQEQIQADRIMCVALGDIVIDITDTVQRKLMIDRHRVKAHEVYRSETNNEDHNYEKFEEQWRIGIGNLKYMINKRGLGRLESHMMFSKRIMGEDNKGHEPMLSIMQSRECNVGNFTIARTKELISKIYARNNGKKILLPEDDINSLGECKTEDEWLQDYSYYNWENAQFLLRDTERNVVNTLYSWEPVRLPVDNEDSTWLMAKPSVKVRITYEGALVISQTEVLIDPNNDRAFVRIGTDDNNNTCNLYLEVNQLQVSEDGSLCEVHFKKYAKDVKEDNLIQYNMYVMIAGKKENDKVINTVVDTEEK